jgi:hypothetical protein
MISLPAPPINYTMSQRKLFQLQGEHMPLPSDADSLGDLLFFSPSFGWTVAKFDDTQEMIEEHKCTYWTWTPETPPADDCELDSTRTEYLRNTGWLKD